MDTKSFFETDYNSTLFPLKTNRLMVAHHATALSEYIYQRVLNSACQTDNFLSQQRVYATKRKGHLRRTFKLDPVAEYFIYDLCYRNRAIFRLPVNDRRLSFGYRFEGGSHVPINTSYRQYRNALQAAAKKYKHHVRFDIASYFNSIYHHDLAHWFSGKVGPASVDARAFGQFLREINAGRSIDVLPQGIYPCKMLGSEFLKFVDLSIFLKSSQLVRFMDDFVIFDDSEEVLQHDFFKIQQIIGQYALNVNPSKTVWDTNVNKLSETLDRLKESLSEIVDDFEPSYDASGVEFISVVQHQVENKLDDFQVASVINLLKGDDIEESDADQILSFLRTHSDSVIEVIPELLQKFPNLIKHIHAVCKDVDDKNRLSEILLNYLKNEDYYLEYQLFWIATIVDDYLITDTECGDLISRLFELTADHRVARAKILEIATQDYGLKEQRNEYLKTGQSDWLSWAAAMGSRTLDAAERNYVLGYFSKASPMNYLIAECVKGL